MLWFRKSKKGFTLIELMVVVAIIGVLALLGLRLYTGQQAKAKEAIVKANAGTVHTLIQSELADGPVDIATFKAADPEGIVGANLHNPFTGVSMEDVDFVLAPTPLPGATMTGTATAGQIIIDEVVSGIDFRVTGVGNNNIAIPETLEAKR
jgi:type IV pilus assembly protein PilA